jgi:two-component system, chemotaxis family, sensor kinase CheA
MSELEQFKATYFQECFELLGETEENLAELEQGARDLDLLHAVFRAIHSIKGGAGAFGFNELVGFAHAFETLLDLLREQKIESTPEVVSLCIRGVDIVSDLVTAARDGVSVSAEHGAEVKRKIEQISGADESAGEVIEGFDDIDFVPVMVAVGDSDEPAAPAGPATREWIVRFKPHRGLFERANDPLLLLRELAGLGTAEIEAEFLAVPNLSDFDAHAPLVSWSIRLSTLVPKEEIEAVFEFVDGDCDLAIDPADAGDGPGLDDLLAGLGATSPDAPAEAEFSLADIAASLGVDVSEKPPEAPSAPVAPAAGAPTGDAAGTKTAQVASIRVDLDKIDRVVDMVGELVITQAMLTQQIDDHLRDRYPEIVRGLEVLAQHTRSLQDSVMSIRAQPVKSVFSRMPRLVRELSAQLGKKVRLEMTGENTEIDKTVIEQLSDPLTHMIRNSLDHGVESPEKRKAAGKAEEGVIRLSAEQAGGRIIIQVGDDGAGINRQRVLAKAMEKGIVQPDATPTDEEIDELIFAPGFSTAETVTNVSGRGVGMDVVRQNIAKLGGRVGVRNNPGRGATMVLTLPLTLAVLDVMLVRVAGSPMVVPLASIVESMKSQGATIGQLPSGQNVLRARGEYVPVLALAEMFGLPRPADLPDEKDGFLILCEADGNQRLAIAVDQIIGQQQVVIKSLEANFERLEGIAGATILGDGAVALILDVASLRRVAERRLAPASRAA